jgi:hypothetical protein
MAAFVDFLNDNSYIKLRNNNTSVTVFLTKANLLIQRDSAASFLVRNDNYTAYVKYADVNSPTSADIDDLIAKLVTWVDGFYASSTQQTLDTTSLEELNKNYLRTAVTATAIDELTYANASSTYDASTMSTSMDITVDPGSRIVRQSREYVPAIFVAQAIVIAQATLHDGNVTDFVTSRVGAFEDNYDITVNSTTSGRGAFFEFNFSTGTISVVLRSNDGAGNQSDTKVVSSSWNIDVLDGTGASGLTLDATTPTFYAVDWDPVEGRVKMGVLVANRVYYCHEFTGITKFNVPVRWELTQTDPDSATDVPSAAAAMIQGKGAVYHIVDSALVAKSIDAGITKKVNNDQGLTVPLISVRLLEENNRARLSLKRLIVFNTASGGIGRWELVLNATLTGASFSAVTDSLTEISTAETDATGGKVMASGFVSDDGMEVIDLTDNDIYATASIPGVSDVLTLRVTNVSGFLEMLSGAHWYERE